MKVLMLVAVAITIILINIASWHLASIDYAFAPLSMLFSFIVTVFSFIWYKETL